MKILEAKINWRFDSEFFALNIKTEKGNKALTFSSVLENMKSPSTFDKEYPEVINVFEQF